MGEQRTDQGGELDPRTAAELLAEATRRAESEFDLRPPLLMLGGAITVLIAYGAVWLSVRHQHPYTGPTAAGLAVLYGTVAVWIAVVTTVMRRALSGRSSRQRRSEGIVFAVIWAVVYVFQGAIHHVDPDHAIAYGIYPAAAPLIIVGGAAAAHEAAKEHWEWAAFALGAVLIGALAAFAGPNAVWGLVGIGLAVLLAARAGAQVWLHRA
jgi:4-amino-4-deoxy-L-arabinose transferase-like glycosyltransferase